MRKAISDHADSEALLHDALRLEQRHRTDDYRVQVMMIEPLGHFEARVRDVSGSGLRLQVPSPLEPGDSISILLKNLVVEAKVRYCVEDETGGLEAGVQIRTIRDRPAQPVSE